MLFRSAQIRQQTQLAAALDLRGVGPSPRRIAETLRRLHTGGSVVELLEP